MSRRSTIGLNTINPIPRQKCLGGDHPDQVGYRLSKNHTYKLFVSQSQNVQHIKYVNKPKPPQQLYPNESL